MMSFSISKWSTFVRRRPIQLVAGATALLIIAITCVIGAKHIHRKPPSIFDTAADDILSYLSTNDFNRLSLDDRVKFIQDIFKRFGQMKQSESVVVSSFLAGLTGPANEKLVQNARRLGKDIFVQGASEYLALKTDREREAFLDQWIVKWIRFSQEASGRQSGRSDEQELDRLSRDARKDLQRGIEIDAGTAQRIADFWERDVSSVCTPKEQAQIYQFGPALRQRILSRSKTGS